MSAADIERRLANLEDEMRDLQKEFARVDKAQAVSAARLAMLVVAATAAVQFLLGGINLKALLGQ